MVLCDLTPAHSVLSLPTTLPAPHSLCSGHIDFLFLKHTILHPTTDLCTSHSFYLEQPLFNFECGLFSSFRPQLKWLFPITLSKVLTPPRMSLPFPSPCFYLLPSVSSSLKFVFWCVYFRGCNLANCRPAKTYNMLCWAGSV